MSCNSTSLRDYLLESGDASAGTPRLQEQECPACEKLLPIAEFPPVQVCLQSLPGHLGERTQASMLCDACLVSVGKFLGLLCRMRNLALFAMDAHTVMARLTGLSRGRAER